MKLIQYDNDYVIYLNNCYLKGLDLNDTKVITEYVKDLLIKLNEYYNIRLKGFYRLYVYINEYYGIILEVIGIDNYDEFGIDDIELKVIVKNNCTMYLCTNNYDAIKDFNSFYIKNNKYYININNFTDNFINYSEFFDIIYKDIDKILMNAKYIRRD